MLKKTIIITITAVSFCFAQSGGNSGLSFLKIGFGARNIALGDAGSAFSNDVTALYYNPAKLANNGSSEAIFMHNSWIQDIRSELAGAKTSIFGLPVAIGLNVTNINDIEVRTQPGDPISKFNANYFSGSIGTGFRIMPMLDFGFSIKYLYENIFVDEANGLAFDFGINYQTPINGLNLSASIRNIGSMNALRYVATKLPTEIRGGTSYKIVIPDSKLDLIGGIEFLSYTRDKGNHLNLGSEITYDRAFSIRCGYQSGYLSKDYTYGVGLVWGNFVLDYAYVPFKLGLGSASVISVQFKL
jgi:hypothetical protein